MAKKEDRRKALIRILLAHRGCVEILCKLADDEAERGIKPDYLAPFRGKRGVGKE